MANDFYTAGIARRGASGSFSYSVIGSPLHPVTHVSWADAARFANWLHNGHPPVLKSPPPPKMVRTSWGRLAVRP
jgi:formylglycine-generating enzyme required for sulfatase activity